MDGSGFRMDGSGFRVQCSVFRVQGAGFRVQGSGFRVQGTGFRVQGSGFRVQDLGFRVWRGLPLKALGVWRYTRKGYSRFCKVCARVRRLLEMGRGSIAPRVDRNEKVTSGGAS